MNRAIILSGVIFVIFLQSADAQVRIEVDMNDASVWTIVQDPDAVADFGFDYSIYGIPEAPSGNDTQGIRMAANVDSGLASAIAVTPKDISLSGQYNVSVDVWLNYYADFANVGTTEFGGLFVGYDAQADTVLNGAGLLADTDGDTSRDYRLYKDANEQFVESGQYDIATPDNTDPDLVDMFLGMEVPDEQLDDDVFDPPNEYVEAANGTLAFGWHTFLAVVDADEGTANFSIDGLSIGTIDATSGEEVALEGGVALMMTDIFTSIAPEPEFAFAVFDNLVIDASDAGGLPGDFDGDGELTATDIDALTQEIKAGRSNGRFDVNGDGDVDLADHAFWIKDLKRTWFGDANLDDEFSSSDFVFAFQAGEYEDGVPMNSGWGSGDWNADTEFDSTDFVTAFQDGGFEMGPVPAAAAAIPEPSTCVLALIGLGVTVHRCRRSAKRKTRPNLELLKANNKSSTRMTRMATTEAAITLSLDTGASPVVAPV